MMQVADWLDMVEFSQEYELWKGADDIGGGDNGDFARNIPSSLPWRPRVRECYSDIIVRWKYFYIHRKKSLH